MKNIIQQPRERKNLGKSKLNSTEDLICKFLIDSNSSHDEIVLISNVLINYDDMKDYRIVQSVEKI